MWMESYNRVYGASNNPFDVGSTPGGSSGGSAAMVSGCASPFAVTSDVGGSTRIPSFFCCLFGHKPTGGLVPNTGTIPPARGKVSHFCQLGPTARHAADLWPLLRVIAGPDGADPNTDTRAFVNLFGGGGTSSSSSSSSTAGAANPNRIAANIRRHGHLRVINLTKLCGGSRLAASPTAAQAAAQRRVIAFLRDTCGCEVVDGDGGGKAHPLPEMTEAFDIWAAMLGDAQPDKFATILNDGRERSFWWPLFELLVKWPVGGSVHTFPALGLALLDNLTQFVPSLTNAMLAKGAALRGRLDRLLGGGNGSGGGSSGDADAVPTVLILPTLPRAAPRHHAPMFSLADPAASFFKSVGNVGIFNVMELLATAVPLGVDGVRGSPGEGRPLGIQVVAAHGRDDLTIGVALALEEAGLARWEQPPPPAGGAW